MDLPFPLRPAPKKQTIENRPTSFLTNDSLTSISNGRDGDSRNVPYSEPNKVLGWAHSSGQSSISNLNINDSIEESIGPPPAKRQRLSDGSESLRTASRQQQHSDPVFHHQQPQQHLGVSCSPVFSQLQGYSTSQPRQVLSARLPNVQFPVSSTAASPQQASLLMSNRPAHPSLYSNTAIRHGNCPVPQGIARTAGSNLGTQPNSFQHLGSQHQVPVHYQLNQRPHYQQPSQRPYQRTVSQVRQAFGPSFRENGKPDVDNIRDSTTWQSAQHASQTSSLSTVAPIAVDDLSLQKRCPLTASELGRLVNTSQTARPALSSSDHQVTSNSNFELTSLLNGDPGIVRQLKFPSRDVDSALQRGALLHRLHQQIDQAEASVLLDTESESGLDDSESVPTSSIQSRECQAAASAVPRKPFSSWFEFYDNLRKQRMTTAKQPSFCQDVNMQTEQQQLASEEVPETWMAHGTTTETGPSSHEHQHEHERVPTRRWLKLFDFQKYIRTQVLLQHSLATDSSAEPCSSVLPHLPPQVSIAPGEARRTKLLARLRTEGQLMQRDVDETKRARCDFLKEVVRHRTRFVEFHTRNLKITRRFAQTVGRQVAARGRKDLGAEAQIERERLAALRAKDEVQYMKLLRETKNQRLLELVDQTEEYMNRLGTLVKDHREAEQKRGGEKIGASSTEGATSSETAEENRANYSGDALIAAKNRYFELAHSIQEDVVSAPSILRGGDLREYQLKGLSWMVSLYNNNLNGILADAMGLGKTIQTVALLGHLFEVKGNPGPFLIVAPLSTLHSGWVNEFKKWLPVFRVVVYDGSKDIRKNLRLKYFGSGTSSVTANSSSNSLKSNDKRVSFNVLLTTDFFIMKDASHLRKINWEYLIVDEAHRLKNPRSKLVQVLTDRRPGRGFKIKRRLALTGTPLQNDLQEVWALLNFLMPTIFNSSETFEQWFNAPLAQAGSQHQTSITDEEQLLIVDRLHKVLRPFLLRREKKEVENEVPQKHEEILWCPMSGLQEQLYKSIESKELLPSGVSISSNTLMQLRKVCNHPYLFCLKGPAGYEIPTDESLIRVCGKFSVLDEILTKLKVTGHRVLIFSQMVKLLNILEVFLSLRGWTFLRLDGSTSSEDRFQRLALFNQEDSPYFIFLLSTKAGGLGVNLQSADTVIIYDSDWNPQNDEQAQSRAHRIGQTREVLILRLVSADTVEERILKAAGVKLDKDALVIKSGMFYDSHQDLEDERRNRVRAILSKKNQRQAATFYEHGAVNRILARTEEELLVFTKVDKRRRLLGLGDLMLQSAFPPVLNRLWRQKSGGSSEWRSAYGRNCPWVAKNRESQKDSSETLVQKKVIINQCIVKATTEVCSYSTTRLSAASVVPFINVPDPAEYPTYSQIIHHPMCLNYIKAFAEKQNFSSLTTLEKYLARISHNCRLFNGPDHLLFHQALRVTGVVLELAREYCCEAFAELDRCRGLKTPRDVEKIKKTLDFTPHYDDESSSDEVEKPDEVTNMDDEEEEL